MTLKDVPTIEWLRKNGFKVRVNHRRAYFDPVNNRIEYLTAFEHSCTSGPLSKAPMQQKGGVTVVEITRPDVFDFVNDVGVSTCHSDEGYKAKKGAKIALIRALYEPDVAELLVKELDTVPTTGKVEQLELSLMEGPGVVPVVAAAQMELL